MPLLLQSIQALIQDTISVDVMSTTTGNYKQIALLNFLAAALQVMPEDACCDTATKITRLIDSSSNEQVKT